MRWQDAFTRMPGRSGRDPLDPTTPVQLSSLEEMKAFLDWVHIKYCLVRPYFLTKKYPVVEARELLPSFDSDSSCSTCADAVQYVK